MLVSAAPLGIRWCFLLALHSFPSWHLTFMLGTVCFPSVWRGLFCFVGFWFFFLRQVKGAFHMLGGFPVQCGKLALSKSASAPECSKIRGTCPIQTQPNQAAWCPLCQPWVSCAHQTGQQCSPEAWCAADTVLNCSTSLPAPDRHWPFTNTYLLRTAPVFLFLGSCLPTSTSSGDLQRMLSAGVVDSHL